MCFSLFPFSFVSMWMVAYVIGARLITYVSMTFLVECIECTSVMVSELSLKQTLLLHWVEQTTSKYGPKKHYSKHWIQMGNCYKTIPPSFYLLFSNVFYYMFMSSQFLVYCIVVENIFFHSSNVLECSKTPQELQMLALILCMQKQPYWCCNIICNIWYSSWFCNFLQFFSNIIYPRIIFVQFQMMEEHSAVIGIRIHQWVSISLFGKSFPKMHLISWLGWVCRRHGKWLDVFPYKMIGGFLNVLLF